MSMTKTKEKEVLDMSVAQLGGVGAVTEKKLTKEKTADVVWNACSDGSKNQNVYMVVFTKELIKTEKFDKTDATKWFNQWEQEGVILKNKNGTYRKA